MSEVDPRKAAFPARDFIATKHGTVAHVIADRVEKGAWQNQIHTTLCNRTTRAYHAGNLRLCEECWTEHVRNRETR